MFLFLSDLALSSHRNICATSKFQSATPALPDPGAYPGDAVMEAFGTLMPLPEVLLDGRGSPPYFNSVSGTISSGGSDLSG